MRIIDTDFRTAICEMRLYPFDKAERKTNREKFGGKGKMPDSAKSFRKLHSGEDSMYTWLRLVKRICDGL